MEVAIQNYENVPVWLEFPRKGWGRSSIGAHLPEPTERAEVPSRKAGANDRGEENTGSEVVKVDLERWGWK